MFSVLCAALFAVLPSPSPSASPSPIPEIAHVYTTDRRDETLKNAARTTYVVTRAQIERHGYRTVAEAIAHVPGVQMTPYGPIGSSANYGIRGSSGSEVLVLVDGLPAPGTDANSVELGNLPTTGVDRIEIVEGGGSTLYGTGAIGGIINVITDRSDDDNVTVRAGSFGDRELSVQTNHLQFSRIIAGNAFGLPGGTVQPNSDYEQTAFHAGGAHRIGSFDALVRAGVSSDHVGVPGPYTPSQAPFVSLTAREADLNEDANLTLSRKTPQAETTFQFGGTSQRITFGCDPSGADPFCFQTAPSLDSEGRLDFGARNVVAGAREQLLYGIDLSRAVVRADAGGTFSTNALAQTAAYAQQNLDFSWGRFYAGMRGERDGGLGGALSPSLGAVVRLSNEASIKMNAATAFRAPNASELYFPGYSNPQLFPERAKVGDLSILDSHFLGGASLGWFTNRTDDLIVATAIPIPGSNPPATTYMPENVDRAFIQGLTFEVSTPPLRGFVTSFNATDLYRAENLDTQTRLPNDPVLTLNLRLDYTAPAYGILDSFGASVHMEGARGFVDPTQPLFDQPAAFSNVGAFVRFRAGTRALVTLRGYNLGDERYAALGGFGNFINGYPLPGRSFILEVSAR